MPGSVLHGSDQIKSIQIQIWSAGFGYKFFRSESGFESKSEIRIWSADLNFGFESDLTNYKFDLIWIWSKFGFGNHNKKKSISQRYINKNVAKMFFFNKLIKKKHFTTLSNENAAKTFFLINLIKKKHFATLSNKNVAKTFFLINLIKKKRFATLY